MIPNTSSPVRHKGWLLVGCPQCSQSDHNEAPEMATIRKYRGKINVQIRKKGYPSLFVTKRKLYQTWISYRSVGQPVNHPDVAQNSWVQELKHKTLKKGALCGGVFVLRARAASSRLLSIPIEGSAVAMRK